MTITTPPTEAASGASADYVARARGLREQLRANAAQTDSDRHLADADVEAMTGAGLPSMWAPAQVGGGETSIRTVVDATRLLGQGDASAGWVTGVGNGASWLMGLLSDEARAEIWGGGGPVRGAGVLAPAGQTERTEGGVRLTGEWSYMSGVTVADWVLVTAPVNGALSPGAELGFLVMPKSDIHIDDTWFVTGMRGTASRTAVADDVFVPNHRILRFSEYSSDNYEGIYRSAVFSVLSICLVGTIVGEAEYALEFVADMAPSRSIVTTTYRAQTDSATFQAQVGKAAQLIQAARLTLEHAADAMDEIVHAGRITSELEKAQNRADCAFAVRSCWSAVDLLASAHGTSTFAQGNPLERIWRNAGVAARHAGLAVRAADEIYGRSLLGLETQSIGPTL